MSIRDYRGLTYEAASRQGAKLVEQAARTGAWIHILPDLASLAEVMRLEKPDLPCFAQLGAMQSLQASAIASPPAPKAA